MPPIISVHLSDLNSKLIKSALYVKVHDADRLFISKTIVFVISFIIEVLSYLSKLISNIYSSLDNITFLSCSPLTNAFIVYVLEISFFVFVILVIFTEEFSSIFIIP